jgi:hypothetical protein
VDLLDALARFWSVEIVELEALATRFRVLAVLAVRFLVVTIVSGRQTDKLAVSAV